MSELNKIIAVKEATTTNVSITEVIKDYYKVNPLLSQQTFNSLKTYLLLHTPNIVTASSQGYANSATNNSPITLKDIEKLIDKRLGNRPSNTTQNPPTSSKKKYCWRHGFNNTHAGPDCNVMLNDKTGLYTAAHLASTSPKAPAGGNEYIQK